MRSLPSRVRSPTPANTDTPPWSCATRWIISWMRTVLPTPAPPNRPILPPSTYGVSRSMTLMPVSNSWVFDSSWSKAGGLAVDRPALGDLDLLAGLGVQHLADDVEDLALGDVADRDRDRGAGVAHLLAADQAVGGLQGDGADEVVAEVLGDLEGDLGRLAADRDVGLQRVVDLGDRVVRELDVDDGAGDAGDAADAAGDALSSFFLAGALSAVFVAMGVLFLGAIWTPRASAPPTISEICWVISAWRALFARRV